MSLRYGIGLSLTRTISTLENTRQETEKALIVCHDCDLLQSQPELTQHGKALCHRCGAVLYRSVPDSAERVVALSVAGLILLAIANLFPFLAFDVGSQSTQTNLFTGVRELYLQGLWELAALVFFTCIAAPLLQLLLMLHIFLPIVLGRTAPAVKPAYRLLVQLREWNMIEVFMIGILVSLVKLTKMATIVPGIAMWSFMILIFVVTGAITSIDGRVVWDRIDTKK